MRNAFYIHIKREYVLRVVQKCQCFQKCSKHTLSYIPSTRDFFRHNICHENEEKKKIGKILNVCKFMFFHWPPPSPKSVYFVYL